MLFTIALIVFNLLITVYLVFGLAIIYHLKKYRWPNDLNIKTAIVFIIGSLFFVSLAVFFFISVPWQSIQNLDVFYLEA